MKKEQFLKCRNEILQIFQNNNVGKTEAPLMCASVLNEFTAGDEWGYSIMLVPLVFDQDCGKK